ncbi:MAG: hypothetical protein DRP35_10470 [Candidatus Zixiibacteriota bacterium]|nr:MAG: hypothetical protein DRP35_10470 [candidate division Zixibacteria bacterium]
MMKQLFLLLFSVLTIAAFPQNMDYAHYVLNNLGSEDFKGRGFVGGGDKTAAGFIKSQLDSLGVKPVGKSYFQPFTLTVNTFPEKIFLSVDGKELIPGKDFLLDMHSGSADGKFPVKTVTLSELKSGIPKNLKKSFVLLQNDTQDKDAAKTIRSIVYANLLNAAGYLLPEDKLVNEPATEVFKHVVIKVKSNVIDSLPKVIKITAKNKFLKNYQTQNVFGYIQGKTDSFIVFSAHYDHLGKLGERATFYGANDNGSGVTMLLNLANYFTHHSPHYSILFMFFSGEEEGLLGSFYAAQHPVVDLKKIKFLFNLDMVGTGQEGIQIVNSTVFKRETSILQEINDKNHYLVKIKLRGPAANSDHYPFYDKGVPSFFIYTLGGSKQYHNIYDKPDQLSLFAFPNLVKLLIGFEKQYQ